MQLVATVLDNNSARVLSHLLLSHLFFFWEKAMYEQSVPGTEGKEKDELKWGTKLQKR